MREPSSDSPWRAFFYPAVVAVALVLRWLGPWKLLGGVDLAALIAFLGGWRIFYTAVDHLLRRRMSGDLPVLSPRWPPWRPGRKAGVVNSW